MLTSDTGEKWKKSARAREWHNGMRTLNDRNEPILLSHLNFFSYSPCMAFGFHFSLLLLHQVCFFSLFLQINVYDVSRWVCNSITERQTKHYYFLWFAFMKNRMRHKHQRNEIQWIFSVSCLKSNWKSLIHKSMCSFRSFLSFVVAIVDWSFLRHYHFSSLDFLLTTRSNNIITIQPVSQPPPNIHFTVAEIFNERFEIHGREEFGIHINFIISMSSFFPHVNRVFAHPSNVKRLKKPLWQLMRWRALDELRRRGETDSTMRTTTVNCYCCT